MTPQANCFDSRRESRKSQESLSRSRYNLITPPPDNTIYPKRWNFTQVPGLTQSLTAPGMPPALAEYHKGWAGSLGFIPIDRPDMWSHFYNYYLNLIRDNDRGLRLLVDAMDDLDLWKNTVVVVSADWRADLIVAGESNQLVRSFKPH